MRDLTRELGIVTMIMLAMARMATAGESQSPVSVPDSSMLFVTNTLTLNPTNAAEFASLKAKEVALVGRRHELEERVMKALAVIRESKIEQGVNDPELQALAKEIAEKQAVLEKRRVEKYPEMGKKLEERNALMREDEEIGKELREVRYKMDVMEGRIQPGLKR